MSGGLDETVLSEKCRRLLGRADVRFAGIIDKSGNIVAGGFKEGLVPLEGDRDRLHSFLEFVSKTSIRKELDDRLGPINYLAARRDKVVLISFPFPIREILLLVSAEPSVNIEDIAGHVVDVFSGVT